jgi:hypothetical protein
MTEQRVVAPSVLEFRDEPGKDLERGVMPSM